MARSSIGNAASESLLDVLIRVNATQKTRHGSNNGVKLELDRILDKYGLYVIDFTANNAPDINSYIYKLCIDACKESQENTKQLRALTHSKSKHRVMIFDSLNCFNFIRFKNSLDDDDLMNSISMVREPDSFSLLITIYRYFTEQAALNFNLRLIIIYCDDLFISDLMEFLIQRKLSLYVVLVSYNVSNNYSKGFYNGEVQGIEFLFINSTSEKICIKKTCKGKVKAFASFDCPTITKEKLDRK